MKKSLEHLPEYKQEEIKEIADLVRSITRPELIILYGSYARGDHVEKDVTYVAGITEVFQSDIDILIIFENKTIETKRYLDINKAQNDLNKRFTAKRIKSPVSLEWNNLPEVNLMITEKNPFMRDIAKQGIELYSSGRHKLSKAGRIGKRRKKQLADEYFNKWYKKAIVGLTNYQFNFKESKGDQDFYNKAAFELHQTTEACLRAVLYSFTFYYPKTHNIEKLYESTRQLDKRLENIFPMDTEQDKYLFELLRKSYVDARYSSGFKITQDELEQISKSVANLMKVSEKICGDRIGTYG